MVRGIKSGKGNGDDIGERRDTRSVGWVLLVWTVAFCDTSSDGCCARLFDLWDMWVRFWWRSALLVCYHVFDISCLRTAEEGIAVDDYVLGKMRATKWDDRTTQLPI